MNDRQMQLYQQVILEHNKKPRNYGDLGEATHKSEGYNPLCGDHLWVELVMGPDSIIQEIKFKGDGCAISKASASMMTTHLKGKSKQEAVDLINEFNLMVKGELDPESDSHSLARLKIFAGVSRFPSRIKCAVLAWHAANGALNSEESVTTE